MALELGALQHRFALRRQVLSRTLAADEVAELLQTRSRQTAHDRAKASWPLCSPLPSAPAVVRIDLPPPKRPVQPVLHALAANKRLLRIYSPDQWDNTALTFRRRGGPRLRFNHHSDHEQNPDDQSRGIHYSAPTLEGCLVEVFGDDGLISTQDRRLGSLRVDRLLRLLDLRGEGAWKAGATQAICSYLSRATSQQWARFFYDTDPELD